MFAASFSAALGKLRDRFRAWQRRTNSVQELARLAPDERDRVLQDIGLSMSDMQALSRPHAGPEALLPHRLATLGLDAAYFEREQRSIYRDMQRTCVRCSSWRNCARDLTRGDVQTGMAGYCLNAETIDSLLVENAGTSRHG